MAIDYRKRYTPQQIHDMPMPPKPSHPGGPGWYEWEQMKIAKAWAELMLSQFPNEKAFYTFVRRTHRATETV